MFAASLRAQAKINLRLRILAREETGYHQIETLFCRLDLADEVRLELTPSSRSLTCDGPAMPAHGLGDERENLAFRAAERFLDAAGQSRGFRIEITKRIPVGGGLGGGSADAGAVLRILRELCPGGADSEVLRIAGSLGADVPFLTQDVSSLAYAWGRGDRVMPLPSLPSRACTLVVAPFEVNTGAAYGWLAGQPRATEAALVTAVQLSSWSEVASLAANDFEDVVLPRHPALGAAFGALSAMQTAPAIVRMSGSGASLFVIPIAEGDALVTRAEFPSGFRLVETSTAARVEPVLAL